MSRLREALLSVAFVSLIVLPVFAQNAATNQAQASGGRYDQQIMKEVQSELQKHDWAKNIRVAGVEDGIVTLEGAVPVYLDKERAYQKIHNKEHVQGVRNLITVSSSASDAELQQKLADRLRYDRIDQGIMFNSFELGVKNGVVTIAGQARTPTDAESALAIVENTPGVKDVVDDIKVLPTSFMDDETRIRVARAVYGDPALNKYAIDPQAPIRIVVDNGHVTLDGVVDNQMDKQIAGMRAGQVPNVFSVTNNLMVAGKQEASKQQVK
jgi:osmotically-inducible protein OsmY